MFDIARQRDICANPKVKVADAGLGNSVMAVYESWATELGLSPTVSNTSFGMFTSSASTHQWIVDLGFSPFLGVSRYIAVNTEGHIFFYPDSVIRTDLDSAFYSYTIVISGKSFNACLKPNKQASTAPIMSMFIKPTPTSNMLMNAGSRYQTDTVTTIMYFKWNLNEISMRFNSAEQTLDVYVEKINDGTTNAQFAVYDYTDVAVTAASYTVDDTQDGVLNFDVTTAAGNLARFSIDKFPTATISGIVRETEGSPIVRQVSALDQVTKELKDTTMSDINGNFELKVNPDTDYIIICEDNSPTPKNALIYDRINVPL